MGGPLDRVYPKEPVFNVPYDIQGITTDELPPVLPVLSVPTQRGSRENHQYAHRIKLIEYEEQQREELV